MAARPLPCLRQRQIYRHNVLNLSLLSSSVRLLPNLQTRKERSYFDANWHNWSRAEAWNDQLWGSGGQRSRSHKAEDRFEGLAEASFSALLGRVAFLVVAAAAAVWQGDHSPDNVQFPDNSLTVRGTPVHVKCYSRHACTSVIVSGGGRTATVDDPIPKWNAQTQQSQEWTLMQLTINSFRPLFPDEIFSADTSPTFSRIPDISLTAVKIPDISRFSIQVLTLFRMIKVHTCRVDR